ncbi:MAG TPA: LemA family protein [Armatimonadota bacterium]
MGIPVFVIALVVLALFVIGLYNGLVARRNRVKTGWAQVDVQLKRRHDLIPNLVETAKGYMAHERATLEAVVAARQQAVNVSGVADAARAENQLTQTLRSLFAVAESYPDLKANTNMLALQEELTSTENKIAFARQNYNDEVNGYNTAIEQFPGSFIANSFGFQPSEFFQVEDPAEREAPQVKF